MAVRNQQRNETYLFNSSNSGRDGSPPLTSGGHVCCWKESGHDSKDSGRQQNERQPVARRPHKGWTGGARAAGSSWSTSTSRLGAARRRNPRDVRIGG